MNLKPKQLTAVVCHDAGGAEVIGAYINAHASEKFACFVAGPAAAIFKRRNITATEVAPATSKAVLQKKILEVEPTRIITGTGWATKLEVLGIEIGRVNKIQTVAYLDHWTNYRERFGYPHASWRKNLPNEIWVGDEAAQAEAKKHFGALSIKLEPNQYFVEIKKQFSGLDKKAKDKKNVLWVCEPVSAPINFYGDTGAHVPHELEQLDRFLEVIGQLPNKPQVIIRRHPAEKKEKYNPLEKKYANQIKFLEANKTAVEDIARSSWVVGMSSVVLVMAALCDKNVISTLMPEKLRQYLPYGNITATGSAVRAAQIVSRGA
jgi:hypothetical protein